MSDKKKKFLDALDTVGEIFPDIPSIVKDGTYKIVSQKKSDRDQIEMVVKMYAILKNKEELNGRNLEALCFYLEEGYDQEKKEKMARQLKIKQNNLNQINSNLRAKKYIIRDDKNKTKNFVDPELIAFKEKIVDQEKQNLLIKFI